MTPLDDLKLNLVALHGDLIHTANNLNAFGQINWIGKPDQGRFPVRDTEYLQICRDIRQTFTQEEKIEYLNAMRYHIQNTYGVKNASDWDVAQACWEDQAAIVVYVKGKHIPV